MVFTATMITRIIHVGDAKEVNAMQFLGDANNQQLRKVMRTRTCK